MKSRKYFHIDEINNFASWTRGKLLDAMECGQVRLLVKVSGCDMVAWRWEGRNRVCIGQFDYEGVVQPQLRESKLLLDGKPASFMGFTILESAMVSRWRQLEGRGVVFPNEVFSRYKYQEPPEGEFHAAYSVRWGVTVKGYFNLFKEVLEVAGGKETKNPCLKDADKGIILGKVKVNPEQLRFCINDLEVEVTDVAIPLSKPTTNPLQEIVERLVSDYPSENANVLWNRLKREVNLESESRRYDLDKIIDSIDMDAVSWFGRGTSTINRTTYKRFRNLVSSVRQLLK